LDDADELVGIPGLASAAMGSVRCDELLKRDPRIAAAEHEGRSVKTVNDDAPSSPMISRLELTRTR
jgi:hypothetical protein